MAGVQVRLSTQVTSDDYITGKLWERATLKRCPWHAEGRCNFYRHGTYERVSPPGTYVARWYCPLKRRTVSALPDCLASHRCGTLDELEATVRAVEQAPSLAAATITLRTDIELPGALRYLSRLCRQIHTALTILRGLQPETFLPAQATITSFAATLASDSVLMTLRELAGRYLPLLPAPLGFNPRQIRSVQRAGGIQHRPGRAPPVAFVDPCP